MILRDSEEWWEQKREKYLIVGEQTNRSRQRDVYHIIDHFMRSSIFHFTHFS